MLFKGRSTYMPPETLLGSPLPLKDGEWSIRLSEFLQVSARAFDVRGVFHPPTFFYLTLIIALVGLRMRIRVRILNHVVLSSIIMATQTSKKRKVRISVLIGICA